MDLLSTLFASVLRMTFALLAGHLLFVVLLNEPLPARREPEQMTPLRRAYLLSLVVLFAIASATPSALKP